ncbi:Selenophosphate synthase (Selenide, water dikinase) [Desulfatibacillum aliphaticivorans]|uniref:Selenide, water dikinase n=2 Tax=Desulfatibacillum aliphaticivorans TaxID=218208 RepID=B8FH87_DESAL|nr:Selenophosphate synthase (Selenide, water dikinase) [Desulfatibacillum aliphaticivorans]
MAGLPDQKHPDLLVGTSTSDDAGVFRLTPDIALVQTLDFFTPIVDSPYHFGQIAAANSLSDVYAMGGRPLTAMNIVCFPVCDLPNSVLTETLRGGLDKMTEAGVALAGGHSVDDKEFKYGLSVTGVVHPSKILTNANVKKGDLLVLTKPIGTGVLATAVKGQVDFQESESLLIEISGTLNRRAGEIMHTFEPHACTDVTGFGLAGHALEMSKGSNLSVTLFAHEAMFIPKALELASMGLLPAGTYANRQFCENYTKVHPSVEQVQADLVFDPQTSGGLLVSMTPAMARDYVSAMNDQGLFAVIAGEVGGRCTAGSLEIVSNKA